MPALAFAEIEIHAQQISRKEGGFVATRAGTYLEGDVLAVFGVGRQQEEFDVRFNLRDALLGRGQFLAG